MPRLIDLNERETVDLHAPWWSEKQDANGRYLERCVVPQDMTEADEQWVNSNAMGAIKVNGSGRKAMRDAMSSLRGLSSTRTYLFLRMIRELTDDAGHTIVLSKANIERLPKRDAEWINDQMGDLYEPDVAPVLEEDEERAAFNESRGLTSDEMTDPETIAAKNFRRSRHAVLSGEAG